MKKVVFTIALACIAAMGYSQSLLSTVKSAGKTAATNAVTASASQIVSALDTKLNLNSKQESSSLSAVTSFLNEKSSIASLATTNAAAYATKLAGSKSKLLSNLKTILTVNQYANLLGLKSSAKSTSTDAALSVLSQIL
ncbi:hypothetical protein FW774_04915 (plasmid) [Pedobacter sp. BS3]|uniref:hypothetical protein n=1 Tax=Pedobacter sp. BS3 TaxID=2567937 RepID=UPI0011EECF59|nr:hypothetical protein [Pedobacter sp. BS3]TZF86390.1 hypothetical protein FW774_04915 [Pedobacter sp. BS3]